MSIDVERLRADEARAALKAHEEAQNPLRLPWKLSPESDTYGYVLDCDGNVMTEGLYLDCARLIAAAPELLGLVRDYVERWDVPGAFLPRARTILARIDGGDE